MHRESFPPQLVNKSKSRLASFSEDRRLFLFEVVKVATLALGWGWASSAAAIPGTVPENEKSAEGFRPGIGKDQTAPKKLRIEGCAIRGRFSQAHKGEVPQTYKTSGDNWMDAKLNSEYMYLCTGFQVHPMWMFYDDSGAKNALATPEIVGGHPMPHGTVLFGKGLFAELLRKFGNQIAGEVAAMAIAAHEWAHILQFQMSAGNPKWKYPELHADFMSGWYMAHRWKHQFGMLNLQSAMKEMWDIGDFHFNSPDHHGTQSERLNAFVQGGQSGAANVNVQQAFFQGKAVTGY